MCDAAEECRGPSTGVISRKAKDHAALRMTDRGKLGECFAGEGARATLHSLFPFLPPRSYLVSILAGANLMPKSGALGRVGVLCVATAFVLAAQFAFTQLGF